MTNFFNPNRDWNFQDETTNEAVASNWSELTAGYTWQANAAANLDLPQLINQLISDIQTGGQIIDTVVSVIGAVAAA